MIDFERSLNSAQFEAVKAVDGNYLVIAGAGSGKTRALTYRVAYLIEKGVKPESILLLTFTRKAADEMIERASALIEGRCNVAGGTFHSFCASVLRKYCQKFGFKNNFTILDQSDSVSLINFIRSEKNHDDPMFPKGKTLQAIYSKVVNKDLAVLTILEKEYPRYIEYEGVMRKVFEEYRGYKKKNNLMDYDDLLLWTYKLLSEDKDVRKSIQKKYSYVMVDEYQDTNPIQARIADLISGGKNIMVVGDDCQSIYGFRGADWRNIMDFPKLHSEVKIINLERNYRSTQPILDFTNKIVELMDEKYEKRLYTESVEGEKPKLFELEDGKEEAEYIVGAINHLLELGVPPAEIAVLYRTNWASNRIEQQFNMHGLDYVKYGGLKFLEKAHVKDVISHLNAFSNNLDSWSWTRILKILEGIGPKNCQKILDKVGKKGVDGLKSYEFSKKSYSVGLEKICDLFERIMVTESVEDSVKKCNEYVKPYIEKNYPDDYKDRLEDIKSLELIAAEYSLLSEFLQNLSLDPPQKEVGEKVDEKDCVIMSTIHQAKGLEWDNVFIIQMNEGQLPHKRSLQNEHEIGEEMRLFYVAATRARKSLTLTRSKNTFQSYGFEGVENERSRFLNESIDWVDFEKEKKSVKKFENNPINFFKPASEL